MAKPPTARVRELETLLAKIANAGNVQLNYDMWERHGAEHATPEQRVTWEADLANAMAERDTARAALEALVERTRAEAPAEIIAWADAHDAYLAAFLQDLAAGGESAGTAASVATDERAAWAEVRSGTRTLVDENGFYVTRNEERYRTLFGIDPKSV